MLSSAAGPHRPTSALPIVRFVGPARRDVRTLRRLSVRVITVFAVVVATVSVVAGDARAVSAHQMEGVFRSLSPSGWIAADGGYSIPLSGSRTAWVFGDTLISRSGPTSPRLVPNSIVVTSAGPPRVLIGPLPSARDGSFYWPADGHVASGSQIWLLCLQTISDSSGIHILGNYLARLDVNTGRLVSLRAARPGVARRRGVSTCRVLGSPDAAPEGEAQRQGPRLFLSPGQEQWRDAGSRRRTAPSIGRARTRATTISCLPTRTRDGR